MIARLRHSYRLRTTATARAVFAELATWGAGGIFAGASLVAVHLFT